MTQLSKDFLIEVGFRTQNEKFFIPVPAIKMQLQLILNEDRTASPSLVSVFALVHLRRLNTAYELLNLFHTLQGQQLQRTRDLSYLKDGEEEESVLKVVKGLVSLDKFRDILSVIEGFDDVSEFRITNKPSGVYQENLSHGTITGLWCSAGFVDQNFIGQVFIKLTSVQFLNFKYKLI